MHILAITCFHGRHRNVERVIRHFLDQDYEEQHTLLLYNNSTHNQELSLDFSTLPSNKVVVLINNHLDFETKEEYTNTGAIFRDALNMAPKADVVTFFDSDDSFLPNHILEGAKGMKKAQQLGCFAYKPYYSYFLYENKCKLLHNTLEPSIFVDYQYIKNTGFNPVSVSYHQKWLDILTSRKQIFVDPEGVPTLLYNWSEGHGNHKISGGSDDESNFKAHRKWESDHGDGILTPAPFLEAEYFYRLAKNTKNIQNA